LKERNLASYRDALDRGLAHAGALRIDHAMGIYRLFWIPDGLTAAGGAYVRYPFPDMLRALAEVSSERRAIIIGEDLGVVPAGFRDTMRETEIQGYRVFFFEKESERFIPAARYPREALACVTTHDLHTLEGWWTGHDIAVRCAIGMIAESDLETHNVARSHERRHALGFLEGEGLLPPGLAAVMRAEADPADAMPDAFAAALYRAVARTPSRLVVVPAEDLAGAIEQVNVPGTMDEHPNWRRRLPLALDDLVASARFEAIVGALRAERPK
jgi:4-alpha-glucanotransferase